MEKPDLGSLLARPGPVLLDGAVGTELTRRGVDTRLPLWSAHALVTAEGMKILTSLHEEYARAGAEVLVTNTFRTTLRCLQRAGRAGEWRLLNRRAVEAARAAAEGVSPQGCLVAGGIAPLEDCYRCDLVPPQPVCLAEHRRQVELFAELGIKLISIETMNSLREAHAALVAVRDCGLEALLSLCPKPPSHLLSGEPLQEVVPVLLAEGARRCAPCCSTAPRRRFWSKFIRASPPWCGTGRWGSTRIWVSRRKAPAGDSVASIPRGATRGGCGGGSKKGRGWWAAAAGRRPSISPPWPECFEVGNSRPEARGRPKCRAGVSPFPHRVGSRTVLECTRAMPGGLGAREHKSSSAPALCGVCGRQSPLTSAALGVCGHCIHACPNQALPVAHAFHRRIRRGFGLPASPPRTAGGVQCALCAQQCQLGEGERGYCGLRTVRDGRLVHWGGTPGRGILQWYRDVLPTNCVADWVCTGHRQVGMHNLAVFYASCTLNCLFCQNWHFRQVVPRRERGLSAAQLAEAANRETYCVCFFGGDPASQMLHALAAAQRLAEKGVTVCWETSGTSNPKLLDRAVQLSLVSGGCVKFDLKAYDEGLHVALTGSSNRRTLENFARAAHRFDERPRAPLLIASTLLVPGYVEAEEVGRIAGFIAALNPNIPYSLLGFAPHFCMLDLPRTSLRHAEAAAAAARAAGLTNVHLGNRHLLSREY